MKLVSFLWSYFLEIISVFEVADVLIIDWLLILSGDYCLTDVAPLCKLACYFCWLLPNCSFIDESSFYRLFDDVSPLICNLSDYLC